MADAMSFFRIEIPLVRRWVVERAPLDVSEQLTYCSLIIGKPNL